MNENARLSIGVDTTASACPRLELPSRAIALGTMLVVLGHSDPLSFQVSRPEAEQFRALVGAIYRFHMPFFFFVSGYLFGHSNRISGPRSYGGHVWCKARRLLGPYLLVNLLAGAAKLCLPGWALRPGDGSASALLWSLAYPFDAPVAYSWFLASLFAVFLAAPLLARSAAAGGWSACFVTALLAGLSSYGWTAPQTDEFWCWRRTLAMSLFFWLGLLAESGVRRGWRQCAPATAALMASLIIWRFTPELTPEAWRLPWALLGISGTFALAAGLGWWLPAALRWLEPLTFPVYLLSWFAQVPAHLIAERLFPEAYWPSVVFMFAAGLLLPWAAARGIRRRCGRWGWLAGLPPQRAAT